MEGDAGESGVTARRVAGLKFKRIGWPSVGWAVHMLANSLMTQDGPRIFKRPGVYGHDSDGAAIAVMLSHALGMPWLRRPRNGCVWVDAFYDPKALAAYRAKYRNLLPCVWVAPFGCPILHVKTIDESTWLVLPWQNDSRAEIRAAAYAAKLARAREKEAA